MSCRLPVLPLDPLIEPWPKENLIHRIYCVDWPPEAFNPGVDAKGALLKPTRFAPIRDTKGRVVPYLYGGSSRDCALFETIFHDVPIDAPDKVVDLSYFANRAHGEITLKRELKLVNLNNVGLHRLKVPKIELIESSAGDYFETAKWAEAIHQAFPSVDGLQWTSQKCDPDQALILFGDRLGTDLTGRPLSGPLRFDAGLHQAIVKLGLRAGIAVS